MKENSSFNLINKIKYLAFCGLILLFLNVIQAKAAPLSISATPTSKTVTEGQSATYTIKITRVNFTDKVTLSVTNLPAGATAVFSPNNTSGNSATMTVTTKVGIQTGSHQLSVRAAGNSIASNPITVTLIINSAPSVSLSANPTSRSMLAGGEVIYEITFNRTNYSGSVTLHAAGLPATATATFSYDPGSPNKASVRVTSDFALGNSMTNFTVGGTANGATVYPVNLKLRTNCNIQWARQIGWNSIDEAYDVTTDRFGNVIIVGGAYSQYRYTDVFVAKYYSDGTLAWSRYLNAVESSSDDYALSVVTDDAGNIYVGGVTDGFMQSDAPVEEIPRYNYRWWVAKLDINGVYHWVKQDPLFDFTHSVKLSLDSSNNINVYAEKPFPDQFQKASFNNNGQFLSQTSFALASFDYVNDFEVAGDFLYTASSFDGNSQIQKYNLNGSLVWTRNFQVDGFVSRAWRIKADSSGNIFIGGHILTDINAGYNVSWVRKMNSAGNLIWQRRLPPEDELLTEIEINSDGNLIVAGENVTPTPTYNQWLSKFNAANGYQHWIRKTDCNFRNDVNGLHSDSSGNIFIAGSGNKIAGNNNLQNFDEAWVIKYSDPSANTIPGSFFILESSARPGQVVRLLGNNLSNVEEVFIGDKSANFTIISSTEIRVTVPAITLGDKIVSVRAGCESVRNEVLLIVN